MDFGKAAQNVMGMIGQGANALGGAMHNVQNYFQAPNPYPALHSPIPNNQQITSQLPPGYQSPIPTANIIQHPAGVSAFQQSLNNVFNHQAQAQALPTPTPTRMPVMPTQTPTPVAPVASPNVKDVIARIRAVRPEANNVSDQQITQYYQKYGNKLLQGLPTPTPAPQPGVSQMKILPTQIPGVNPQVAQNFTNVMNNRVLPITRIHGIPDAVAVAQAAQESGFGQKAQGNNYFGLMHFDPQTGQRSLHTFNSPEDAATFYSQTVSNLVPNVRQMTPLQVVQALQSGKSHYEGDNANPMQYVYDVTNNPAWSAYGGGTPYTNNPWGK